MSQPPHTALKTSCRPEPSEMPSDYQRQLVDAVDGDCVMTAFADQTYWLCELASSLSVSQVDTVHSPYQWTVRQVIEHCADAERIFGDRMLRIAAGDSTDLPTWNENAYADSRFGLGNFGHLITELGLLRQANVLLLRRIEPKRWDNRGVVGGEPITVRAIAWIAAGHLTHHLSIIEKRCKLTVQRTRPMMN